MKALTANQIRSLFLDYFRSQGHTVVDSAPLIPHNDPTLMFTSAGMVQFKDCFLGAEVRPYKRATTAQKCLRAGGKHNDLENVGFTARHHTFFEMLGNFSFGDYFKKDAIHFGWEFVTKKLNIPKDRLYVTVFRDDDEAAEIWHKQEGVARDRIYRFGEKDNFWAAGDTGPCGPCSEIFVDRGEKYGTGPQDVMGGDGDRFMEIWNLVFMQYDRDSQGKLNPLAKPSIDTGSGLERVASVLQDVDTNYDIDSFQSVIRSISDLAKIKYRGSPKTDVSMRVIADHCRATNFLMADGVLPSNEGRGYVLRRIMRRAIRHGRNLGFQEPFFHKLTQALIHEMGSTYPELSDKREFLESNIKLEEERFLTTLDHGIKILEENFERSRSAKSTRIPGDVAFKLYDTFGFPLDLTQVIASERGMTVDEEGFQKAMNEQRSRSRESWKGSGEEAVDEVYKELSRKGLASQFLGYSDMEVSSKVLAVIEGGTSVSQSSASEFQVVVAQTPFYAESGGQVGDQGLVHLESTSFSARVVNATKQGDMTLLSLSNAKGSLPVGGNLKQSVDRRTRALTAKNHTATHMLHHALRKFLGTHVKQAGSLVTPELLRFDFSHTKPLTDDELVKIEDFINDKIALAQSVQTEETSKEAAIGKGAIAFFGDKYGDKVRVVSVGDFSVELCGGTHVRSTADIQAFKILNENGIAAGVRRITAVTGPRVVEMLRLRDQQIFQLMDKLNTSAAEELLPKVERLIATEKELRKTIESHQRKAAASSLDEWISQARVCGQARLITGLVTTEGADSNLLREMADQIRSRLSDAVIALAIPQKDQATLLVAVSKNLQAVFKAGDIVKQVAPLFDGKGGGKPDMAQAGGKSPEKFPAVFDAIEAILKK